MRVRAGIMGFSEDEVEKKLLASRSWKKIWSHELAHEETIDWS